MGVQQAMFMGGDGLGTVTLTNRTVTDSVFDPNDANASFVLQSGGTTFPTKASEWLVGGSGSSYECRATMVSGTLSSGTTGSWLVLSSNRGWTKEQTVVGSSTASFDLEIREKVSTTVKATARITLTAEVLA